MKRSVTIAVIANLLFGVIPVYWKLLGGVSNMYILGHRMLWSILFTVLFAAIDKKLPLLKAGLPQQAGFGFLPPVRPGHRGQLVSLYLGHQRRAWWQRLPWPIT